jgi:mono/diheme cytochrome c family protein
MRKAAKSSKRLRWILFVSVLALIVLSVGLAMFSEKPWVVPPGQKSKKNPLSPSTANLAAAREIYRDKCSNCHGDTGKGDGSEALMYDPLPTDLTNAAHMRKLSDGEVFYQITEGKKPMPSYKNKLTEQQRWQLVLLVRSFSTPVSTGSSNTAAPDPPTAVIKPNPLF